MIWQAFLVLAAIAASGLFSGVETAFVACPRLKIRHLAKRGVLAAQRMEEALRSPEAYLTSLLVGTNLAVVGGTVVATRLAERLVPGRGELIATLVLTPVFLVAGEILPKSYFLAHARALCVHLARPLEVLRILLRPFATVVGAPARLIVRSGSQVTIPASREELVLLARTGTGTIRLSGAVRHVLEERAASTRRLAGEVMTPRDQVVALPADVPVGHVLPLLRTTGFTHYPLERGDRWIGFVHVFDLIERGDRDTLAGCASPLPEVDQDASLEGILRTMRATSEHVVAVVRGGMQVGLLTLEDVVSHLTVGLE